MTLYRQRGTISCVCNKFCLSEESFVHFQMSSKTFIVLNKMTIERHNARRTPHNKYHMVWLRKHLTASINIMNLFGFTFTGAYFITLPRLVSEQPTPHI